MKNKSFIDVFGQHIKSESLPVACESATVNYIEINQSSGALFARLAFPVFVDINEILAIESVVAKALNVSVTIEPQYPKETLCDDCFNTIMSLLKRKVAAVNGTFEDAECHYQDGVMQLILAHGGLDIIHATKTDKVLEQLIKTIFGCSVEIVFKGVTHADIDSKEYRLLMEDAEREAALLVQQTSLKLKEEAQSNPTQVKAIKPNKPADPSKLPLDGLPIYLETAKQLFGSSIRERPTALSDLDPYGGTYTVWGRVFDNEMRAFRDGAKLRYTFKMTDQTNSITLILWVDAKRDKSRIEALDNVKNGTCLLAAGIYEYDRFVNDNVMTPKSLAVVSQYVKQDTAVNKRIELHMHTKMSSLDAISDAESLVMRAAEWGHKAVAITDHGVAQAFPDAMNAAVKAKGMGKEIKVLYGIEAYYINDSLDIVQGGSTESLDGDFIVFDIETTGLNAQNDRMTEIGALHVCKGEVLDSFSTFVNPGCPISKKITEITGITDEMVKDAPGEKQALEMFYSFCGDNKVLVAHNAPFDTSFIKAASKRCSIKYFFTSLDTLPICRALYPELKNHKLNTVAAHVGFTDFNHHRALDDARALSHIFVKLIDRLKNQRNITMVDRINTELTGADAKKARPFHMIIFAQNKVGLKNLYKLISWSHLHNFYRKPRITKTKLLEHREGLLIGSACEQGELFQAVFSGKAWGDLCDIARFYDFLEIQPISNNAFMVRNGTVKDENQLKDFNQTIVRLGEKLNIPVCATCDVHFMDPEDEVFRRILMAGQGFADADIQAPLYF
ncbi:MAG: PHP domain-containing protein, partial [Oscillospiraceae bacterium]|nr:PHP domain-containing protein [Oscillospiraceae bacterium]